MTISTTTLKNSYSGNGSTTSFAYTYPINTTSEITVIERSATGTETVKTEGTGSANYGIVDNGAAGGTITMVTAPANGTTLIILRNTDFTQETDYVANDPFPAETHEDALDKLQMQNQELQEELDRSIKLSRTNTMTSTEFTVDATNRANKILAFDENGEISVTQELGTFVGNWSSATSYNARDLVKDTSTNNVFICRTSHTSSGSQPLTTNTDSSKWSLLVDAAASTTAQTAAASSATAAATSETNAASSAASALSHKNDSETAKTASETAQTAAETARTAAQTAQAAAEAALDNFDDRFLGAKASDPTLDNDGAALTDGALYFDTTNNVMKVYDLGNTTWRQIQLTTADQANVNTVAAQISPTNNISTVAGLNTEITNVAGLNTEITNLNNIRTDISQVSTDSADVQTVATDLSGSDTIGTVATDLSGSNTIGTVATNITPVQNVNTNLSVIQNVNTNLASVNNFGEVYRISATAPTTSLDNGDMWFDTTAGKLKIWNGSSFDLAGSSINGTSARFKYTATASQTTFTGADDNGNTLAYDSGFTDVYLNGVKLVNGSDYTATDGSNVVLTTGASVNDILEIVGFGTFSVADFDASGLTGTINIARLADNSVTNAKLANQSITINGSAVNLGGSVTVGETKPTVNSISPDTITNVQTSIIITGSNFVSVPQVEFLNPSTGIWYVADTVTYNNSTSLTANATLGVDGTYKIRIENPDGNAVISSTNILTVSDAPTWTTSAGTLGTFAGDFSGTLATVVATSDSAVTFSEVGSNLASANVTLSSGGVLSTTDFGGASTTATTYNFTIRATDAENQTADRSFSLTSSYGATGGGQFN